ncbi:MAG: hypothetical protein LBN07_02185 [Christensenellaceae bacterium]|jgi:DNA polymerase III epsilon subunit family exonuclease|nr:hypothetical protein [Christensenellaceae bacterium]
MNYSVVDFINNKTGNTFSFLKLHSAVYKKSDNKCMVNFIYPEWIDDLTEEQKEIISKLTREFLSINAALEISIRKSYLEQELLQNFVMDYFSTNHASISDYIKRDTLGVTKEKDTVTFEIAIDSFVKDYFLRVGIESDLLQKLGQNYCGKFFLKIKELEIDHAFYDSYLETQQKKIEEISIATSWMTGRKKRFNVDVIQKIVGDPITTPPEHISLKEALGVIAAGKMSNLKMRTFKSKRTTKDEKGNLVPLEKQLFSFTLKDGNTFINCVYFATKATVHKMNLLLDKDCEVVIKGNIEKYGDRMSLKVRDLSLCKILDEIEEAPKFKSEASDYYFIKPRNYEDKHQVGLFENKTVNKNLLDKTFVVFDLETTGMTAERDEIIEIGAVKIENGVIVSTFGTLIKPSKHIPEDATAINNITDEMVINSPTINQVLPDFYKYTRGATLVAHNAEFDCKFIAVQGKRTGYNFDNPIEDTLALSRLKLSIHNHKLKTVCDKLNIPLIGAHRAVADAVATAHVFMKLY